MSRDPVMSSPSPDRPDEVASKVLRRAQVSKMTRALQDRLALANIKIKHGWQHRSIESLEPEIERELKRRRTEAQLDLQSDSSSTASGPFSTDIVSSSPLTSGPTFSDDLPRSGSSHSSFKRPRADRRTMMPPSQLRTTRSTVRPKRAVTSSWKTGYQLPESSPSFRRQSRLTASVHQGSSQYSDTSTIQDDPSASEDDDEDIPLHSFQRSSEPQISSSPPRTPPPAQSRSATLRANLFSSSSSAQNDNPYKEGAELLVQFAMSPSPGMHFGKTEAFAPATPPTKGTPLPSSGMMHTPGTQLLWGVHGPNTPNTAFNFADFVNVTPSPAQGPWSKTPGTATARTPAAARETRRRLNFDSLMAPPTALSPGMLRSPAFAHTPRTIARRVDGLGMELGGELHSSQ